jgi:2,3-bisphosphoglycerate-independent phosphoglycerate mutase
MLVTRSIESGAMFRGAAWQKLLLNVKTNNSTLHFIGLFSDGNVHSHLDHLKSMLERCADEKISRVRIHILLDGRDVGETTALDYIRPFEVFLSALNKKGGNFKIASGGGRMNITMDRYGANWDMVRRGWETHVLGRGRMFKTAEEAVEILRQETSAIDQDLPPFIIEDNGKACGTIEDGDSVIFFNFRGDRALELTAAFEEDNFTKFDRIRRPSVEYAGMMQYDGDLKVPKQYLVDPPFIERTMGEYLANTGLHQLAVSETQKFGHVTYFFNGNRSGKFNNELETYIEIPSDIVPFEQRPWMKAAEITDLVISEIQNGNYQFIRLNFPNGDMVGHTGKYQAAVCAVEVVDLCLARLKEAVKKAGGIMLVSADHGNSDDMYEHDKKSGEVIRNSEGVPKAKTAHSLNPVPCIVFDPEYKGEYETTLRTGLGISSIAAACIELLGFIPPADYDKSIIEWKK